MANYNNPNQLNLTSNANLLGPQNPVQFPYGNNNMLLSNSPYDNYMGRVTGTQNQFLKCRPVSSKDEARAFQIDLDGSLWVFTDLGSDKIYTKRIDKDGSADFRTYVFTQQDIPVNVSTDYVTKEEFNKTIQGLMAAIQPVSSQEPAPAPQQQKTQLLNF